MKEKLNRRDFLRAATGFAGLALSATSPFRFGSQAQSPQKEPELGGGESPPFPYLNLIPFYPTIEAEDSDLRDPAKSNPSAPFSLAMVLTGLKILPQGEETPVNVTARAKALKAWEPSGATLEQIKKLTESYGRSCQVLEMPTVNDLRMIVEDSRGPVLVTLERGETAVIASINSESEQVLLFRPLADSLAGGQPCDFSKFQRIQSEERQVLAFGTAIDPVDEEGLPLYLIPEVKAWKDQVEKHIQGQSRLLEKLSLSRLDFTVAALILIQGESLGDKDKVSSKGAIGLMQVMPDPDNGKAVPDLKNPDFNLQIGIAHYAECVRLASQEDFAGVDALVEGARAYNGGPGAIGQEDCLQSNLGAWEMRALLTRDHQEIDKHFRRLFLPPNYS